MMTTGTSIFLNHSYPEVGTIETPPGVLRPALETSAQERRRLVRAGPQEDHKNGQRDGTPRE